MELKARRGYRVPQARSGCLIGCYKALALMNGTEMGERTTAPYLNGVPDQGV